MNFQQQYLNLYFQVHQPRRLKRFHFLDVGSDRGYFDDRRNQEILRRIAETCYLPTNRLLLKLIDKYPDIRITFSISGTALEQFEQYAPEVLRSFRQLAESGSAEFLSETYYHSLSYFIDIDEFDAQIRLHRQKLHELIGARPRFFRNTELIYSNAIGEAIARLGFKGMYIDGVEKVLHGRTPNALYRHPQADLVLMPRNYRLSDDIAFRYSDESWNEWPLTGNKFESWLSVLPDDQRLVCLAMDYETFGEHKKASSGIFNFLEELLVAVVKHRKFMFLNPSQVSRLLPSPQIISSNAAISWADEARDLSAWLGNDMQRDAFQSLYKMHDQIMSIGDEDLISSYRNLQTSDHFYYMATKRDADGAVHQYFSPYASPYEAFMNFMNIIADLELRVKERIASVCAMEESAKGPFVNAGVR